MTCQDFIEKMKAIQENLLIFLEDETVSEDNFQNIKKIFDDYQIGHDQFLFKQFMRLLSCISNNHHRNSQFISKIEQILTHFKNEMEQYFTNNEKYNIFRLNKRILLFLIEKKMIIIDEHLQKQIDSEYKTYYYIDYLTPESKEAFTNQPPSPLFDLILHFSGINPDNDKENFEEKRKTGENDSYICELIRNDSIVEFIEHINKESINLNSYTKKTIFETNPLLIKRQPTFIEYAAFFGSIQIFKYLKLNGIEMTPSLWIFAIHGNNPEIIDILEENDILPKDRSYMECLIESIKCHHNDITRYIQNKYIEKNDSIEILKACLKFFNYSFIKNDIINGLSFYELIKYDHLTIVDTLIKNKRIDLNKKIVLNSLLFNSIFK